MASVASGHPAGYAPPGGLRGGTRSRRGGAARIALIALACGPVVGLAIIVSPLAGLGCVLAIGAGLALVERIERAAYLLVAVVPASAGLKRGFPLPGLRLSEVLVVGLGALIILAIPRAAARRWSAVELLLLLYAVLSVVLGGIDLLRRHSTLDSTELGTMLGPVQFVLLVRAINIGLADPRRRMRAVSWMLGATAVVSVLAIAQYANFGPVRSALATVTGSNQYTISLGEGVGRVTGPFNIWHALAGYLLPSILLALALAVGRTSRRAKYAYGGLAILAGIALLSTATLAPLVAVVFGALYLAARRRVLRVAVACLVPAVVAGALIFGTSFSGRAQQQYSTSASSFRIPLVPETIAYRYALFREQSAPALAGRLTTGYGPDLPPQVALSSFPFTETAYVTLLLRGGVPLLLAFLILLTLVACRARLAQRITRPGVDWDIAGVVLFTTLAWLVLQLLESYLLDAGPAQAYWGLVGLMLAGRAAPVAPGLSAPNTPG